MTPKAPDPEEIDVLAFPMHGEVKLRSEGLRTRDAHLLEWFGRLRPHFSVAVASRPEPWPRLTVTRLRARGKNLGLPKSWRWISPEPVAIPVSRDKAAWWVQSQAGMPPLPKGKLRLIWNPFAPITQDRSSKRSQHVHFDLLDDWTAHETFSSIRPAVTSAYGRIFARADSISANSEATLEFARRFGRSDAILVRNGCDPDRFTKRVQRHATFTLGYGGKIGHRLDLDLIRSVSAKFPNWALQFVGPVLIKGVAKELSKLPNVQLLGDRHYDVYPQALQAWDLSWVPHRTGAGEVGGDVIKIYEYRAAGLPVVTTKIIGWQRALDGVTVAEPQNFPTKLERLARNSEAMSIARDDFVLPDSYTWQAKAEQLLELVGL